MNDDTRRRREAAIRLYIHDVPDDAIDHALGDEWVFSGDEFEIYRFSPRQRLYFLLALATPPSHRLH